MMSRDSQVLLPEIFTARQWRVLAGHLGLTTRQAQIARLTCRGVGRSGIARRLNISPHTVRMHSEELFLRLKIHDRIGVPVRLVLAARQLWPGEL